MPITLDTPSQARKQFLLTPAAGKRLIARALSMHARIRRAALNNTVVIVAGTTNGYIAEELLNSLGIADGFTRQRFFRGVTVPPRYRTTEQGRLADETAFPGDVVIERGLWLKGKTIFDVVDALLEGDLILKGANALDLEQRRAAVLVGHPKAGTIGAALQALVGRRVQLILPVGLEKRISGNLDQLASRLNAPGAHGPRLLPIPGVVFTELDAIQSLSGATAELIAGGGVSGAEGSVWLAVSGSEEHLEQATQLLKSIGTEPGFGL